MPGVQWTVLSGIIGPFKEVSFDTARIRTLKEIIHLHANGTAQVYTDIHLSNGARRPVAAFVRDVAAQLPEDTKDRVRVIIDHGGDPERVFDTARQYLATLEPKQ
jgi:hypothetical protein